MPTVLMCGERQSGMQMWRTVTRIQKGNQQTTKATTRMHIWMSTLRSRILWKRTNHFRLKFILLGHLFMNLHEDETTPPPFGTVPVEVVETPDTEDTDVSKRRRAWCDCGLKQYVGDLIYLIGEAESKYAQWQWDYVQCERSPPSSHTIINRAGTTFYPLCRADS